MKSAIFYPVFILENPISTFCKNGNFVKFHKIYLQIWRQINSFYKTHLLFLWLTVGEFSCFSSITLLILYNIQWMGGLQRDDFSQFFSGSVQIPVAESDHEFFENCDQCGFLGGQTANKSVTKKSKSIKVLVARHRHPSIWSPRERFREAVCNKHSCIMLNSGSSAAAQSLVHQLSLDRLRWETLWQPYGVKNLSTTAKFLPSPLSQCATATPTVFRGIPHHNTRLKVSQKVFLDAVTKARFIGCLILH